MPDRARQPPHPGYRSGVVKPKKEDDREEQASNEAKVFGMSLVKRYVGLKIDVRLFGESRDAGM